MAKAKGHRVSFSPMSSSLTTKPQVSPTRHLNSDITIRTSHIMSLTQCQHCRRAFRGEAGLSQYLRQSPLCRAAEEVDFDARVIESEDESELSDDGDGRAQSVPYGNQLESGDILLQQDQLPTLNLSTSGLPVTTNHPPSPVPSVEDIAHEIGAGPVNPNPEGLARYTERYPRSDAGRKLQYVRTRFERLREWQRKQGERRWGQFGNEDTFDMVRWLVDCAGKGETDDFLKQPWVCTTLCLIMSRTR
jgi:hypothetical protein